MCDKRGREGVRGRKAVTAVCDDDDDDDDDDDADGDADSAADDDDDDDGISFFIFCVGFALVNRCV